MRNPGMRSCAAARSLRWGNVALGAACVLSAAGAEGADAEARYVFTLHGKTDTAFVIEREGGEWQPVFAGGSARADILFGVVLKRSGAGALSVGLLFFKEVRNRELQGDPSAFVPYDLTFAASDAGRFTGTWRSPAEEGTLDGRVMPVDRSRAPAPANEHPRFLVRKEEVRALRAKFQTPWGRAAAERLDKPDWSRSNSAVGLGLLYQLTGDRRFADRAKALIEQDMDSGWWMPISGIHDPAFKVTEAVLAYDLIHETCDPAFRMKMRAALRAHLHYLENYCNIWRGNGHFYSNWSAQYRSGIGMAALALLGDPSETYGTFVPAEIPRLSPPNDLKLDEGTPVLPRDGRNQIGKFLVAGPLDIGLGADGLASLGGAAGARPRHGTTFTVKVKAQESRETNDRDGMHIIQMKNARFSNADVKGADLQPLTREITAAFAPVPKQWRVAPTLYVGGEKAPVDMIDLRVASGYRSHRTLYFYAVIDNPKPCTVKIGLGKQPQQRWDPCVYIAGHRCPVNSDVSLESGKYPVMVPVTLTTFVPAHNREHTVFLDVTLTDVKPEAVEAWNAHRKAVDEFQSACRKAAPGRDVQALMWLARARLAIDVWASNAIGDRGWNSEGDCYTHISLRLVHAFAHAHRNAVGVSAVSTGNLGWVLPQAVCRTVFADDGARMHSYGRGGGPFGVDEYARGFGLVPGVMQPGVFWAWKRTQALADAGRLKSPEGVFSDLDPASAAFLFVNWPFDAAQNRPAEPENPEPVMPKAVADRQRTGYTFRNRWKDGDDIVAMVTGWNHPGGGWADGISGDLRLLGLGAEWAVRGACSGANRNPAGILQLPHLTKETVLVGREVVFEPRPDGSGVVTLDFRKQSAQAGAADPVVWRRSLAVDFGRESGASALMAVVDTVPADPTKRPPDMGRGSADPQGPNRWQLVTHSANQVAVGDNAFLVTAPNGATLAGTVVVPAKTRVWTTPYKTIVEDNYQRDHVNGPYAGTVIHVAGEDRFFVVMTLQKDAPPRVAAAGETVQIGGRRLTFDGQRIVLGK
jgi:hypothetical protein